MWAVKENGKDKEQAQKEKLFNGQKEIPLQIVLFYKTNYLIDTEDNKRIKWDEKWLHN